METVSPRFQVELGGKVVLDQALARRVHREVSAGIDYDAIHGRPSGVRHRDDPDVQPAALDRSLEVSDEPPLDSADIWLRGHPGYCLAGGRYHFG